MPLPSISKNDSMFKYLNTRTPVQAQMLLIYILVPESEIWLAFVLQSWPKDMVLTLYDEYISGYGEGIWAEVLTS